MCGLSNKILAELNEMSKEAIIAEILQDVQTTTSVLEYDEKGNQIRRVDRAVDAWGKEVGTKIITWSYYATGEVNEIIIEDGKERLIVKHYRDGKQPTAELSAISAPVKEL